MSTEGAVTISIVKNPSIIPQSQKHHISYL